MPHLVVECSANVADITDVDVMIHALHDAAIATGVAPLDALRTRLVVHQHYVIADERPENKFVAVSGRFLRGRAIEDQQRLTTALMDALVQHLGEAERDIALSVEYQEIVPETRLNRNSLQVRLESGT
jgi:5-carboxymethyl-2-hydroxymuconate isomerase